MRIAVLGLGAMGSRMARRLLAGGHSVTVWNRTSAAIDTLGSGVERASTPRAAVQNVDVVMSMVTDDRAARAVWLEAGTGAVHGLAPGTLAIESSTVTPAWIAQLQKNLETRAVSLLDAPVLGSRPQAESGQLVHLVGGGAADLARAMPVLSALSGAVHHMGISGTGAAMKLAVNALFAAQVATCAEWLAALCRQGLVKAAVTETLIALPVTSPAAKGAIGLMSVGDVSPLFPIALVEKDLRYALELISSGDRDMSMTSAAWTQFARAVDGGFGADNITGITQLHSVPAQRMVDA